MTSKPAFNSQPDDWITRFSWREALAGWFRCANPSDVGLRQPLAITLPAALALVEVGESLFELSDPW
jgi:hypothetical protein